MRSTLSARLLLLGAALAFTVPAASSFAQDASGSGASGDGSKASQPAKEISKAHMAAARKAIAAIGATDQFDEILPNAATQIKAELIANNPDLESQISQMVDQKALDLASRRGALENEVARIYANLFSEDELNSIAQFYTSDAGKKLIDQGPNATREMMASAQVWGNGIVRDLRQAALKGMNQLYASEKGDNAGAPANGGSSSGK